MPWIAAVLSVTFAFYGLIRKVATLESLPGLVAETAVLTLPAGGFLLCLAAGGGGAACHVNWQTDALLLGAGIVTATPLLLFAYGARRISMATMGFVQYVSPTGALLLAVPPEDAAQICQALVSAGIACADIGRVEEGPAGVWAETDGAVRLLARPLRDEISRVFE